MPSGASASKETIPMPHNPTHQQQEIATIEQPPKASTSNGVTGTGEQQVPGASANISVPIVTCDFASDVSTSDAGGENENDLYKDTLKVNAVMSVQDGKSRLAMTEAATIIEVTNPGTTHCKKLQVSPTPGRCRALSMGIDTDAVSEFEPSSSDSGVVSRCAVVKPLKFRLCQPIFGKKVSKMTNNKDHHNHHPNGNKRHKNNKVKSNNTAPVVTTPTNNCEIEPALPKPKVRDPEKEKRRIARKREKRATLILGLIMGRYSVPKIL